VTKLIYAEPDDEITNLVDRLRSEKEEKELVFVLPSGSRVMHSGLNARLLMQYSNSLGKTSAVVTPDPRTQSVAIETGFRVFPSVAAFEAGGALDHAGDAAGGAGVMAPVENDWDPAAEHAARPQRRLTPAAAAAGAGAGAGTAARQLPRVPPRTTAVAVTAGRKAWIIGGAAAAVVVLLLLVIVLPSATVTIVTTAKDIGTPAGLIINGAPTAPGPTDQLAVQTTQVSSQQQQQQQFNATGSKTIPAVAATGNVVFTNHLGFTKIEFPPGTEVYTDDGKKFVTTADAVAPKGGDSPPTPITARGAGAGGNVAAHTITHVTGAPADTATADNPAATSGGVDEQKKQIISQQDLDNAKKQLGDPLTQKVKDDLNQKAAGQKQLTETGSIGVSVQADRKAGDEGQNFNATVSVTGKITLVDDNKVKDVLKNALVHQVPADHALTDDPVKYDYKVADHNDDQGTVRFSGGATGFMATKIDTEKLRSQLAGKSPSAARGLVIGSVDATDVRVHETPSFIPWLPFLGGRIEIRRQVENTHA
jgi:hypothetical protein